MQFNRAGKSQISMINDQNHCSHVWDFEFWILEIVWARPGATCLGYIFILFRLGREGSKYFRDELVWARDLLLGICYFV
jgi:hypothetical protein